MLEIARQLSIPPHFQHNVEILLSNCVCVCVLPLSFWLLLAHYILVFRIGLQLTCELMFVRLWQISNKHSHLFQPIMEISLDEFVLRLSFHHFTIQYI